MPTSEYNPHIIPKATWGIQTKRPLRWLAVIQWYNLRQEFEASDCWWSRVTRWPRDGRTLSHNHQENYSRKEIGYCGRNLESFIKLYSKQKTICKALQHSEPQNLSLNFWSSRKTSSNQTRNNSTKDVNRNKFAGWVAPKHHYMIPSQSSGSSYSKGYKQFTEISNWNGQRRERAFKRTLNQCTLSFVNPRRSHDTRNVLGTVNTQ